MSIGTHCCGKTCKTCSYIETSSQFKSTKTDEVIISTSEFSCKTKGVIYLTSCSKCKKQYVGQTSIRLQDRFREHLLDIKNNKDTVSGANYNLPGHSMANISVLIIEKVIPNIPHMPLEREKIWIQRLNTLIPHGLNSH